MSNDQAKGFANNIIASATWDGIKRGIGCSLVTGLATAVWEKLKHGSLDWVAIGGMFVLTLVVVLSIFRKKEPTVATVDEIMAGLPKQTPDGKPQQGKPAWQKLQWANAERERLSAEVQKWKDLYTKAQTPAENTEETRQSIHYQNKLIELGRSVDGVLNPLQIDAIQLSTQLLDFMQQLGPPPAPKYTAQEIDNMTSAQMKELINANDGDFFEACEYHRAGSLAFNPAQLQTQLTAHWTRLLPWYQKVAASYALNFKSKVETLHHRFAIEGMSDGALLLPVQGGNGVKDIRAIAARLWELAFKAGEKDRSSEETRKSGIPKRIKDV